MSKIVQIRKRIIIEEIDLKVVIVREAEDEVEVLLVMATEEEGVEEEITTEEEGPMCMMEEIDAVREGVKRI